MSNSEKSLVLACCITNSDMILFSKFKQILDVSELHKNAFRPKCSYPKEKVATET